MLSYFYVFNTFVMLGHVFMSLILYFMLFLFLSSGMIYKFIFLIVPIRGRNKEIYIFPLIFLIDSYLFEFLTLKIYYFYNMHNLRGSKFPLIKYNSNYHTLHFILSSQTQNKFVKIKKGEIFDRSNNQS